MAELKGSSKQDVYNAINRAFNVKNVMAQMPAYQRADILTRTAQLIDKQKNEIAELIVTESGKPIRYARSEVGRSIETFMFSADAARNLHGETIPMDAAKGCVGKIGYYIRVPVGIIGAITPFNFPLNLVAHKVGPAIAAGCPIVLKPSPITPLTAQLLAEILQEAGLPRGAFEVLVGGTEVGKWLTTDPRIAMITFTGSPTVAKAISQIAGIRRTTFELGGNAGVIIDKDVNLNDVVINSLLTGSFAYSGQVCISVQRIYIHNTLYDKFKTSFIKKIRHLKIGDPMKDETDIGPLISKNTNKRITSWIEEAICQGATLLTGGKGKDLMMQATVLENVTDSMQVMRDEIFGPVVNLISYDDFETALKALDNSEFGLQAGIFSSDLAKIMQAIKQLDVGGVIINDIPTFRVDQMPYGGNKNSGVGREGPKFAIKDMTTLKTVVINPQH